MTEGLRTGHVGINVSELERSRDFYCRALGLEVMSESRETEEPDAAL